MPPNSGLPLTEVYPCTLEASHCGNSTAVATYILYRYYIKRSSFISTPHVDTEVDRPQRLSLIVVHLKTLNLLSLSSGPGS